jgi:hypothetical protein
MKNGITIDCRSINGFQGQERDIIIFSLTRANTKNRLGFMSDERRLNVGLTRARFSLYIVGNEKTYGSNATFSRLISHCKDSRSFLDVSKSALFRPYYDLALSAWNKLSSSGGFEADALALISSSAWGILLAKNAYLNLKQINEKSRKTGILYSNLNSQGCFL